MIDGDTIIAQVTSPGKSAVGILRISGSKANEVALIVLGKIPIPRLATYSMFLDHNKKVLDKGISLWFPRPFSFTGEDVLELQGHGSPVIIDLLIKNILLIQNIRMAKPGEFSERAFINGKIDLVQAEAIDDLINAETEASVRSSLNSLQGTFSNHIKELMLIIISIRTNIEASIDFSEEDINIDLDHIIASKIKILLNKFKKIQTIAIEGNLLKEGRKIVIAGSPNAGKSSLFNALSYSNKAIVTAIPGTTRDVLDLYVNINGLPLKIIDTAGLRDASDEIEKIGIQRAWNTIKESDHVLFVIDNTMNKLEKKEMCKNFIKSLSRHTKITFILNKNDLVKENYSIKKMSGYYFISLSAHTGEGIDILRNYLMQEEVKKNQEGVFTARRRHLNQLDLSYSELIFANKNWIKFKNIELLSESLRLISESLSKITGQFTSSDLLNRIFSDFCIGK